MKQGVLEEGKEHTDWVNSHVIVEKDTGNHHSPNHTVKKKLRICLDPRDLNEALEREPYHTRSVDEITIVDFKKGYWMVVLHQIPGNSPVWCYHLADSNGHNYQWVQWLHKTFSNPSWMPTFIGMEGVTGIADDMVIAGRNKMEHDRNFLAFMEKCMENNFTLNLEKIQVSFYGHC